MNDKEYVCGYAHCLHNGQKVKESEAVILGKKRYHWDCALTKQEIEEIRSIYMNRIDEKADWRMVTKILNDLILKYGLEIDYVRYVIEYYADYGIKVKSPFSLLYLRTNSVMRRKWEIKHKENP